MQQAKLWHKRTRRFTHLMSLSLAGSLSCCSLVPINSAKAQIVPDNTLGAESSVVTPDEIKGIPSDRISGGAKRGANLFHSFREFNVGEGRGAYFTNPSGIENILSRVTGSNLSNILGTLGVLGNANLFVINPNGIVFGPNARLDIGGSFFASTADSLVFDGGFEFSATNPQAPPQLTVNIPIGLRFREAPVGNGAGDVTVNGSNLELQQGKTLGLVGGNVRLENNAAIAAVGSQVELGGLAQAGTVKLVPGFSLSFPQQVARADVTMRDSATVDVRAGGGGSIAVNAQNIEIAGKSELLAGIDKGLGRAEATAGDIKLNATGKITVSESSSIQNRVNENATGKSGDINITTGSLAVTKGAQLDGRTFGKGDAGNVNITATDTVSFEEGDRGLELAPGALTTVGWKDNAAEGNGGDINIKARSLSVSNFYILNSSTFGKGDAGNVNITATDTVRFYYGFAATSVNPGAKGKGGNIKISARSLALANDAQLFSSTEGQGDAGNVNITATDTVSFDNSYANSSVDDRGDGKGGNIKISARSLALTNEAQLFSSTSGEGDAGNVNITATDTVYFKDGSFANTSVGSKAKGKGGEIDITTGSLALTNGSELVSSTEGQGDAGNVNITATDTVSLDGVSSEKNASGVKSAVGSKAKGKGGEINITTGSLALTNGAELVSSTSGQGKASDIKITAARSLSLSNDAKITTGSEGNGAAGNITVDSQDLFMRRNSFISTNGENATGGNITIKTDNLVGRENSDITANAKQREGGFIQITAQGVFGLERRETLTPLSDITAFSQQNPELNGVVEINTPEVDPDRGLIELPENVVDPAALITQNPCTQGSESEFIITGRGGVPPNPSDVLGSEATRVDLVEPALMGSRGAGGQGSRGAGKGNSSTPATTKSIIPARGWVFNDKGEVVLTAHNPTVSETQRLRANPSGCRTP